MWVIKNNRGGKDTAFLQIAYLIPISAKLRAMRNGSDLTNGCVPRQLAMFALPLVLANFLQTLYHITDMLIVGRFVGAAGMGAVAVGGQFPLFLSTFSMGLAAGGQILLAQLKGAGKDVESTEAKRALLFMSLLAGALLGLVGFFTAELVLNFLAPPQEMRADALIYLRFSAAGLTFTFVYNAVIGAFRGLGDAKRPLLFAALATALHLGLGFLFVGAFSMGVRGAGLATLLSQAIAAAIAGLVFFIKQRQDGAKKAQHGTKLPHLKQALPSWRRFGEILKIGVPFGLQMGLLQLATLIVIRIVTPYGTAAVAAFGVAGRILGMFTIPMMAIGNASATMIGQSMGANKTDRAASVLRWTLLYTLTFTAVTIIATLLSSGFFLDLFTDDAEVIRIGTDYLSILVISYVAFAFHASFNAVVLGVGFSLYSLLAAGVEAIVGRIGLTWIFAHFWDLQGIFVASTIAPYLAALISFAYVISRRWKTRKLLLRK